MVDYAKIRTNAVVLNPIPDPNIPNSMYVNSDTNLLNTQGNSGSGQVIATSAIPPNIKQMQAFAPIRAGKPVSKRSDGKVMEAESDAAGAQQPIGYSLQAILNADDLGLVVLVGVNMPGILAGMGFVPGEEIFVGESAGEYTNNLSSFTGNNDSFVKLGVADCAAGAASSSAEDLIVYPMVIARPHQ